MQMKLSESQFSEVRSMHKLCNFDKLNMFGTENYIFYYLSKRKRSLCAQIRSGILLHFESGWWVGTSEEIRLTFMTSMKVKLKFI